MELDRRQLLEATVRYGDPGLLGIGILGLRYGQQSHARSILHRQMMDESVPLLAGKAGHELDSLPASARDELRTYFHGICLNVHGFVAEICSQSFAEKLSGCESEDQKHLLLNVAFSQKIVTGTEVVNRVEVIATEIGRELDRNWSELSRKLSDSWRTGIAQHGSSGQDLDVTALAEPLIRESIEAARRATYPLGQRPAISETIFKIGKSAILLLPLTVLVEPAAVLPVFVLAALKPTWQWVVGLLSNRADGYQTAISERLAILGNRVATECEREFRIRIADLHHWQQESLKHVARQKVTEVIPAFF